MNLFKEIKKEIQNIFNPSPQIPQSTPPQYQVHANPSFKTIKHKVAGVSHYMDNILSFAIPNPQYNLTKKEMIASGLNIVYEYKFKFERISLIPEPTNPYDPNAIKVMIDEKQVGYIKKGSCKHILNLISGNRIVNIDPLIGGGNYKELIPDGIDGEKEAFTLERGRTEYCIRLLITER